MRRSWRKGNRKRETALLGGSVGWPFPFSTLDKPGISIESCWKKQRGGLETERSLNSCVCLLFALLVYFRCGRVSSPDPSSFLILPLWNLFQTLLEKIKEEEWGRAPYFHSHSSSPRSAFWKQTVTGHIFALWSGRCTPLATTLQTSSPPVEFLLPFLLFSFETNSGKLKEMKLRLGVHTQSPAEEYPTSFPLKKKEKKKDSSDDSFSIYLNIEHFYPLLLPIVYHIWENARRTPSVLLCLLPL